MATTAAAAAAVAKEEHLVWRARAITKEVTALLFPVFYSGGEIKWLTLLLCCEGGWTTHINLPALRTIAQKPFGSADTFYTFNGVDIPFIWIQIENAISHNESWELASYNIAQSHRTTFTSWIEFCCSYYPSNSNNWVNIWKIQQFICFV